MSRKNGSGGGAVIAVILLILVAALLYQCNGAKYGLPVISIGAGPSSSSAATSATGEPAASDMASVEASADSSSAPGGFSYLPATDLLPWSWTSSTIPLPWSTASNTDPGYKANTNSDNWSPSMCFPLEGKAYANSQVYNPGGEGYVTPAALASKAQYDAWYNKAYSKPKQTGWVTAANNLRGNPCEPSNYQYPWRDNFCEKRAGSDNVVCHGGSGHQGQDIRPETCEKSVHWAVAAEDSIVKAVGEYTLTLRSVNSPYRIYRYLHMDPVFADHWRPLVGTTTVVKAGRRLGRVGDFGPGGVSYTTTHLHFEIRLSVAEQVNGTLQPATTWVPPYKALVASYERKLAGNGCAVTAW